MARSDQAFRDIAGAAGYDFRDDLAASDLAFTAPPWAVAHPGLKPLRMTRSLHKDTGATSFLVAEFRYPSEEASMRQTICAARLREPPEGLDAYLASIRLPRGMHCVRRGDCVYLYADAFSRQRSPGMSHAELVACVQAVESISRGQYSAASTALQGIGGSVPWTVGRAASHALVGLAWAAWTYWMITIEPKSRPGIIAAGVVLLALHLGTWAYIRHRWGPARAYASTIVE